MNTDPVDAEPAAFQQGTEGPSALRTRVALWRRVRAVVNEFAPEGDVPDVGRISVTISSAVIGLCLVVQRYERTTSPAAENTELLEQTEGLV